MKEHERPQAAPAPTDAAYEPPQVEKVMGREELDREVHYAGALPAVSEPDQA